MKRFVTLLLSFGILGSVVAQTSSEREEARRIILGQQKGTTSEPKESRDVILGGDNRRIYDERNGYPNSSSRQAQVDQVNRDYEYKINSIRNNNSLSVAEKERIIRQLEADRRKRINEINKRYSNKGRNDRDYDDDDDDDDDKEKKYKVKKNNGKGRGNEFGQRTAEAARNKRKG